LDGRCSRERAPDARPQYGLVGRRRRPTHGRSSCATAPGRTTLEEAGQFIIGLPDADQARNSWQKATEQMKKAPGRSRRQGGWLDIRSVIGYAHDVPEYRRQLVAEMDEAVG